MRLTTPAQVGEPGYRPANASLTPLRADRYKVQFTAGQRLHDKIKQAQHLLRSQIPSGELAEVVERALDVLIAQRMKQRCAVGRKSRPAKSQGPTQSPQLSDQQPSRQQPSGQQAARQQASSQQPSGQQSASQRSSCQQSASQQSASQQPSRPQSTSLQSTSLQSTSPQSARQQPSSQQPSRQQPSRPQSTSPQPSRPESTSQQPSRAESVSQQPSRQQPASQQPAHQQPARPQPARPQPARPQSSRHIPSEVRRQVFARDGMRCTYVSQAGRRCEHRADLACHHEHPFARGGETSVANVRLTCRAHNALFAEHDYGREFIRQRIDGWPRDPKRIRDGARIARNPYARAWQASADVPEGGREDAAPMLVHPRPPATRPGAHGAPRS